MVSLPIRLLTISASLVFALACIATRNREPGIPSSTSKPPVPSSTPKPPVPNSTPKPPASSRTHCNTCPNIYVNNCGGLPGRKYCFTAAQAKVQREDTGNSCILSYTCPEPLGMYGWLTGYTTAAGVTRIFTRLRCTSTRRIWRDDFNRNFTKISCMSKALTNVYKVKEPCDRAMCAPQRVVSIDVRRNPRDRSQCVMRYGCPVGTSKYIYEAVGQGWVKDLENPITCMDNGPGSSWTTMLAPPFEDAHVQYISCFSDT